MDTSLDLQIKSKQAEDFLNSFKNQDINQEEYKTDSEKTNDDIEKIASTIDFKASIAEVFKNFPDTIVESPLEILKTEEFYGSSSDRMSMVYFYLLKIIEFFPLNGDVLKTNLSNDRDTVLLTLKLEEKLIISFKSSLLEFIFLLLEDKNGVVDTFITKNNIQMSAASTLIVMNLKNKTKEESTSILKTLIMADYILSIKPENSDGINEILDLFKFMLNNESEEFITKIEGIFSENVIKQPIDILKFITKVFSQDNTRTELATNLYAYARNLSKEA